MAKEIKIKKIEDEFEAFGAFVSALFYFITHPFRVSSVIFFALVGTNFVAHYINITADKAQIEVAKPLTANSRGFSLFPEAIAGEKQDSIIINGQLWGFNDPDVDAWKLKDESAVLLHDKDHDVIVKARIDGLDHERMKTFKKGK